MNDTRNKPFYCTTCYKYFTLNADWKESEDIPNDEIVQMVRIGTVFEGSTCAYCADN